MMKGISRFGSMFLLFLALYQIAWSTKCHLVVQEQDQRAQAPVPHYHHHLMSSSSRSGIDNESSSSTTRRRRSQPTKTAISRSTTRRRIPLYDLVDTKVEVSCINKNLVLVNDTRFYYPPTPPADNNDNNNDKQKRRRRRRRRRRIPRIIHVTSKSRCLTRAFAENLELWKRTFPNYTFVLHNDEAMDRFLFSFLRHDIEFPHLSQIASACLHSAAGKADLWRALILYEYGGIYTDIDNAPGTLLLMNSSSSSSSIIIGHDDNDDLSNEAFFVVENEGMLSQYFMAAAPRHALMYLLIQTTLHRVQGVPSVENQYVPFITGPGALKAAFVEFMQAQLDQPANNINNNNNNNRNEQPDKNNNKYDLYQKVRAGRYTGLSNWTVTVVGSARTGSQEFVQRNVIYQKRRIYQEMGMVHFSQIHQQLQQNGHDYRNESCIQRLYRLEQQQQEQRNNDDDNDNDNSTEYYQEQ